MNAVLHQRTGRETFYLQPTIRGTQDLKGFFLLTTGSIFIHLTVHQHPRKYSTLNQTLLTLVKERRGIMDYALEDHIMSKSCASDEFGLFSTSEAKSGFVLTWQHCMSFQGLFNVAEGPRVHCINKYISQEYLFILHAVYQQP